MKRMLALLLCLLLLAGSALAADVSEIRGFDKDASSEYQYLQMGSFPYEKNGAVKPLLWRVLGVEDGQAFLVTEYVIDVHQVYEIDNYKDGVTKKKYSRGTDFTETDLYAWVNGEMTDTILAEQDFSAAIIGRDGHPFFIMSYDDLKNTAFGFPNNRLGYIPEKEDKGKKDPAAVYRKAYGTPYAKAHILYPDWKNTNFPSFNKLFQDSRYQNSSPYWTTDMRPDRTGMVGANGHLSWHGKGDVQVGVRPATIVDLSKMVIVSGAGTMEKPFVMEVAGE